MDGSGLRNVNSPPAQRLEQSFASNASQVRNKLRKSLKLRRFRGKSADHLPEGVLSPSCSACNASFRLSRERERERERERALLAMDPPPAPP